MTTPSQNQNNDDAGKSESQIQTVPTVTITAKRFRKARRPFNPLSKLASYTYNLSLYMLSDEAYGWWVQNGGRHITQLMQAKPGHVVVITQSGGINKKAGDVRAMPLDVYIDDLRINSKILAKTVGNFTNITKVDFSIYEPFSFQFYTRLRLAQKEMEKLGSQRRIDPTKAHYLLGIRFYGWHTDGRPAQVDDREFLYRDNSSAAVSGGDKQALFERYFPIFINKIKFKLDGRMVKYDVEARTIQETVAFGTLRGISESMTIEAETVEDAFNKVMDNMNKEEEVKKSTRQATATNTYKVKFVGDQSWQNSIKNAKFVYEDIQRNNQDALTTSINKFIDQMRTTAVSTTRWIEANPKNPGATNLRNFTFKAGTPLLQLLTSLLYRSSYTRDAVIVRYTTEKPAVPSGPDNKKTAAFTASNVNPTPLIWFNITSIVIPGKYCEVRNQLTYEITYVVHSYETPFHLTSQAVLPKYEFPHKVYDYWYTGQNTEIISYEQTLDNAYYLTLYTTPDGQSDLIDLIGEQQGPISVQTGRSSPLVANDDVNFKTQQAVNGFATFLLDPRAYMDVKINILGDPDFLMLPTPSDIPSLEGELQRYYGNDFYTIKPNGGQVFVEISFKEAVDYGVKLEGKQVNPVNPDDDPGLMTINSAVIFFFSQQESEIPTNIISYLVRDVDSVFSGGKFTQTLSCELNALAHTEANPSSRRPAPRNTTPPSTPSNNRTGVNTDSNAPASPGRPTAPDRPQNPPKPPQSGAPDN